ncbi:MAG: hypothetical protein Kow0098_02080 [Ignavibacteriaceae bacterium]
MNAKKKDVKLWNHNQRKFFGSQSNQPCLRIFHQVKSIDLITEPMQLSISLINNKIKCGGISLNKSNSIRSFINFLPDKQ